MKKLAAAIINRDASALAKIAGKKQPERIVNTNAEKLVDILFDNLIRIFPASRQMVLKTPEDEAAMKRQWIVAFAENGIVNMEQLKSGVRVARQQKNDFWPSCGKFIGWCKEGQAEALGLPDFDAVMKEFNLFNRTRDQYESAIAFPWSHPVLYWIVLDMRKAMHQYNQSISETEKTAKSLLKRWAKKLSEGDEIPVPVVQIADKSKHISVSEAFDQSGEYRAKGAEFLARIRGRASS